MEKSSLLDRMTQDREERLLLARVLDKAEQSGKRNLPAQTDFLSPRQQALARVLLHQAGIPETAYSTWGGYEGAERRLICFLPDWMEPEDVRLQAPLRFLRASWYPDVSLSHRDLLGSLMGLGIVREKLGDLLVGEGRCDLIVEDGVAEFLRTSWEGAGRAKLKLTELSCQELEIPERQYQEIRDTVSSLRLDAVLGCGFQISRTKAAALVESGKVELNWRECTKTDQVVAEGDLISARGFGRMELAAVGGLTRKGRTGVTVRRYR